MSKSTSWPESEITACFVVFFFFFFGFFCFLRYRCMAACSSFSSLSSFCASFSSGLLMTDIVVTDSSTVQVSSVCSGGSSTVDAAMFWLRSILISAKSGLHIDLSVFLSGVSISGWVTYLAGLSPNSLQDFLRLSASPLPGTPWSLFCGERYFLGGVAGSFILSVLSNSKGAYIFAFGLLCISIEN